MDTKTSEKVMKAAIHLFAERGYDSVSVRDICTEAGVSPNALHYHFKNKETLYNNLLLQLGEASLDMAKRILLHPPIDGEDFRTRLQIFFEETLLSFLQNQEIMQIVFTEFKQQTPHADDVVANTFIDHRKTLTKFIEMSELEGIVRSDIDPNIASGIILNSIYMQTYFSGAFEKYFNISIHDSAYRIHWLRQNLEVFLSGMLIKTGEKNID